MLRSTLPLILATVLYLWQAYENVKLGKIGLAWAFVGYAVANIGLILAVLNI